MQDYNTIIGSPVHAGRMDRDTYMEKGGRKDFADL